MIAVTTTEVCWLLKVASPQAVPSRSALASYQGRRYPLVSVSFKALALPPESLLAGTCLVVGVADPTGDGSISISSTQNYLQGKEGDRV